MVSQSRINLKRVVVTSIIATIFVCGTGFSAYAGFQYYQLKRSSMSLEERVSILERAVDAAEQRLASTTLAREELERQNSDLSNNLLFERSRNDQFQTQVNELTGAVGTLTKLSQTDRELLMIYSKVYFLNENYVPSNLSPIDVSFLSDPKRQEEIHANVLPFLSNMLDAAKQDGVDFRIVSAYRSFGEQASVKTGYKLLYGSGANTFSADQGYSEHQLGSTVDMTTPKLLTLSVSFDQTAAYKWLKDNAHRFGFILSYPKGNGYYQYEPWHWRFVGRGLATYLHDHNLALYNLPQRDINSFLVSIFD